MFGPSRAQITENLSDVLVSDRFSGFDLNDELVVDEQVGVVKADHGPILVAHGQFGLLNDRNPPRPGGTTDMSRGRKPPVNAYTHTTSRPGGATQGPSPLPGLMKMGWVGCRFRGLSPPANVPHPAGVRGGTIASILVSPRQRFPAQQDRQI
jgi:hypothetical protein